MNASWIDFPPAHKWYVKIRESLAFSQNADENARDLLYSYRKSFDPSHIVSNIREQLKSRYPLFFGAGPNLWSHLNQINGGLKKYRDRFLLIAADGSTNALILFNLYPDLVISDLDGLSTNTMEKLIAAGTIPIIHGHGDNLDKITEFRAILQSQSQLICTTQVEPRYPIINPGGFTDGDRGLYFIHHLDSSNFPFWLFGYAFGKDTGPFSKPFLFQSQRMNLLKQKKMDFAQKLIDFLTETDNRQILLYGKNPITDIRMRYTINHLVPFR